MDILEEFFVNQSIDDEKEVIQLYYSQCSSIKYRENHQFYSFDQFIDPIKSNSPFPLKISLQSLNSFPYRWKEQFHDHILLVFLIVSGLYP